MKTNKDTVKAVEAATTLIKYCARYKHCNGCIFHNAGQHYCNINYPNEYEEIKGANI